MKIIEKNQRILVSNILTKEDLLKNYGGACENVCYDSVRTPCEEVGLNISKCSSIIITHDPNCPTFIQCASESVTVSCEEVQLFPYP